MLIEVVPHKPQWKKDFNTESQLILVALGDNLLRIHHIGSTAIPRIYAKPIIDILVEVKDLDLVTTQTIAMEELGYEAMGEFGLIGRRYFRKENHSGIRTHHVHIYKANFLEVKRHQAFRDYMIAHPQAAERYSQLKQKLAQEYPHDIEGYMDGKDSFIQKMEQKALQWQERQ
ncbi:MAG: GrpB family protein [Cyanobacteria bacterium J06621_8]